MKRQNMLIIGIILLIAAAGFLAWLIFSQLTQPSAPTDTTNNQSTETTEESPETDEVLTGAVAVSIKNSAYSPKQITVKKGTTVTWTNEDTMGHNVVSEDYAPDGGPAKEAPLLKKGESFSFTFDTVGTFDYYCTPHAAFMKGSVTVVE